MRATSRTIFSSFSFLILTLICISFSNQTNPNLEADDDTDIMYNCTDQQFFFSNASQKFSFSDEVFNFLNGSFIFTFNVSNYIRPNFFITMKNLTTGNAIIVKQSSDYGGEKTHHPNGFGFLAPTSFSIHFNFPNSLADNTFLIIIDGIDITPKNISYFMVQPNLSQVLDSNQVANATLIVQKFDAQHSKTKFQIRTISFGDRDFFQSVYIYDNGVYKGSLLDVFVAQNQSRICEGSQFSILKIVDINQFSILVSPVADWKMPTFVTTSPNRLLHYEALDGPTVYYETVNTVTLKRPFDITFSYFNGSFTGNGTVDIYAGCVTSPNDNWRIATLNSSNIKSFNRLQIVSACLTVVISSGSFQWYRTEGTYSTKIQRVGQQGVFMSPNFPYSNNYVYDEPQEDWVYVPSSNGDVSYNQFVVNYKVDSMSKDTSFQILQTTGYNAQNFEARNLTSTDTNFTSVTSRLQKIFWSVPVGSPGFLVRYTVLMVQSAGVQFGFSTILILLFSWIFRAF